MVKFCQDEIGAVKILDYGLILGGDLGSNILTNLAQQLHDTAVHKVSFACTYCTFDWQVLWKTF